MEQISSQIAVLIYRFLRGELSASEREELDKWLQDDTHRQWFEQLRDKERVMQKTLYFDRLDKQKGWERLEQNLPTGRRAVVWSRVIAASVALLMLAGTSYYLWQKPFTTPGTTIAKRQPAMTTPAFYLSTGEVIGLAKDSCYSVALPNGGVITNTNGTLTFQQQESADTLPTTFNEVKTPRGGEYKVVLPDGTTVWLNAESSLRFPSTFAKDSRKIYACGELYFEVAPDKQHPFRVEVEGAYTVEVLGTAFNIRAYPGHSGSTTLINGSLQINRGEERVMLKPGQQAIAHANKRVEVMNVNVDSHVAWRKGYFLFENTRLEEIMEELQRWYDVEVFFVHEKLRDEHFSVELKRQEEIKEVLKLLEKTGSIEITIENQTVYIK